MKRNRQHKQHLRQQLLSMVKADQKVRTSGNWKPTIDQRNTRMLKKIVVRYGWPTISLVGEDGAQAAWLITQHTPDLSFQKKCLRLLREAVKSGQANKSQLAFLIDKIRVREGKKQIFGTQFKFDADRKRLVPWSIENRKSINCRRKRYGLESFETYQKKMEQGDLRRYQKLVHKFSKVNSPKN